jgi:hypothetical protein
MWLEWGSGVRSGCRDRDGFAVVVHRHDRQVHQQFILDQLQQVEVAAGDEDVVFAVLVEVGRQRFRFHKPEGSINLKVNGHRLKAALAGARDAGLGIQVQPGAGLGLIAAPFACDRPVHRRWGC